MALAGFATPAAADNLDLSEVGAAMALPIITSGGPEGFTATSVVITNTSSSAIRLGVQVISGDPGDRWAANSFSCVVTGLETTHFWFRPDFRADDPESKVDFECSTPDATADSRPEDLNIYRTEDLEAGVGIMFVYVQTISGDTSSNNYLVGESAVIDFSNGYAYQVSGIPFQGADPLAQDGNLEFHFDGIEYAQFPSVLTSNFHAPTRGRKFGYDTDLILFTLDGTISSAPPRARLKINYYNDDERKRNVAYEFRCFDIVSLEDLSDNFLANKLGSTTGHIELKVEATNSINDAHDGLFDGPVTDHRRKTPVHGWIVTVLHSQICGWDDKEPRDDGTGTLKRCVLDKAAFAKTLDQGDFSLAPEPFDRPTFNAN